MSKTIQMLKTYLPYNEQEKKDILLAFKNETKFTKKIPYIKKLPHFTMWQSEKEIYSLIKLKL